MRQLSEAFLNASGRYLARIRTEDGVEYRSEEIVSVKITAGAVGATDRLTLGGTPSAELNCVLNGSLNFPLDKWIELYLGRQTGEQREEILLGRFTITKVRCTDGRTTLTGYDAMTAALKRGYFPTVSGETSAKAVLADVAAAAGLELCVAENLADVPLSGMSTGFTLREMAGYMAALLGANARVDSAGTLRVGWFTVSGLALGAEQIYADGLSLDSEDWTLGRLLCTVAAATTEESTDSREVLSSGNSGGCIELENRWMTQNILNALYEARKGFSYRGGKLRVLGDLRLEVGDIVSVVCQDGRTVTFPIMAQTLEYDGGLTMTLNAYARQAASEGTAAAVPMTRTMERWDTQLATVKRLEAEHFTAASGRIDDLRAKSAELEQLAAQKADISDLTAVTARIDVLDADKLSVKDAEIKYANIDFSNIDQAAVEQFYATSGIIKDLTIDEATVTGELVGVTIKGDLIEGGTVVADKLVVKGEDGLFYKLNTDGMSVTAEQTEYNSLNGSVITARSVTAEKISVGDLVAFGATIGGFHITDSALYSGVKTSADNTTRGVYLDSDGQLSAGDSEHYMRYYRDENGRWRLEIAAASLTLQSGQSVEDALNSLEIGSRNYIRNSQTMIWDSYTVVSRGDDRTGYVGSAILGTAETDTGTLITAARLNAIETGNADTDSKITAVKEAMS